MQKQAVQALLAASKLIRSWHVERTNYVMSFGYFICLLGVMPYVETRLRPSFADQSVVFPDNLVSFNHTQLAGFFQNIGDAGWAWYPSHLACDTFLAISSCVLVSFTVSLLADIIVHFEDFYDFLDAKNAKSRLVPRSAVRLPLLNILPIAVCVIELVQNLLLLVCWAFASELIRSSSDTNAYIVQLATAAGKCTEYKWVFIRLSISFTMTSFALVFELMSKA